MLAQGTSPQEIEELYKYICVKAWEEFEFEICILLINLISPRLRNIVRRQLRPSKNVTVRILFNDWVARHQFECVDSVIVGVLRGTHHGRNPNGVESTFEICVKTKTSGLLVTKMGWKHL